MPDPTPIPSVQAASAPEPEIRVIPDKYYGAALRAKVPEQTTSDTDATSTGILAQPTRKKTGLFFAIGGGVFIVIAGVFVFVNRQLLFPSPVPKPVVVAPAPAPTPAPEPPSAPTNLAATSTTPQSVSLLWVDTASDESGFRLERAVGTADFQSLTNLPPNSSSFLDASIQPGTTYRYRIAASNQSGESSMSAEASAVVASLPPPPPEQPRLPPAGLDSDSDGSSDVEEALFGTNPHTPDTDGDGFLDGNEVFHLYNPNGTAPGKLIDAKLVKQIASTIGWSMVVPTSWTPTIATDGLSASFPSGHGEEFRVSIVENPQKQSVLDWYLAQHPDVKSDQVLQYKSKRGYQGIIGADLLTTYIPWGNRIFVFTYFLDGQTFINYRTTYAMMLNSLELSGLVQEIPPVAGSPLPFEPAATTTGVVAQPVPVEPTVQTVTSTSAVSSSQAVNP